MDVSAVVFGIFVIFGGVFMAALGLTVVFDDDFGFVPLIFGVILIVFGFIGIFKSLNTTNEYDIIVDQLEVNPFDQDALKDAIIYNSKIELAEELDKLPEVKNDYENYLNETLIDYKTMQVEYINENYDLKNILESYLSDADSINE